MSYTALYRKYRPSTFDDIAGQQHIVQTLTNALAQNRLAHAYLFTGPSGNGKTSVAKLFAKAINCESKDQIICDKCSNCLDTKNNIHPDVVEIDAASNNGVDEIRSLIEKVKYSPLKGKYKIYIIDEVHMLSLGAFNALLKTLEEPPAHVVFILATTEPHKVIPTIISRCQRYDFTRVKESDIFDNIVKVLNGENIDYDKKAIQLISNLADGGVRNSLSILEQSVAYSPELVTVEDVRRIYGIVTKEEKLELLDNIFKLKMKETLALLDKISNQGNDLERFNIELVNTLKETVIYSYSKSTELLQNLSKEEVESILNVVNSSQLLQMIDILMDIDAAKKNISDLVSYMELGFIKMISIVENKTKFSEEISPQKDVTIAKPTKNTNYKKEVVDKINIEEEFKKHLTPTSEETKVKKLDLDSNDSDMDKNDDKEDIDVIGVHKTEPQRDIVLNDETLLSLLTFADKEKRISIQTDWENIVNYCNDVEVAKYAYKLCKSSILAIGDNYVVAVVEHNHLATDLNDDSNQIGLTKFLKEKLNEELRVFAITTEKSQEIIEKFKTRAANNTLPDKIEVEIVEETKELIVDSLISKAESVFGKDGFTIEE
ncbi:MAG: DNA polymerase III subunit gamma/tau [Erysipelothrix sp.]|nr:DNA polymerase III subunit gamma/tau [Erysipelothrix sp.]